MNATRSTRLTPQLIIGIFLVVLGVLSILDNLGYSDVESYFEYWPLVLVGIGLSKLGQSTTGTGRAFAGLWILAGAWILLQNLQVIPFAFWDFWPAVFILLGLTVIWRTAHRQEGRVASADPGSTVSALCIWSGADRKSNSADFRGGELTAIMGGCEADLRQARIADGDAVLDLFVLWGGIDILVPPDWTVVSEVTAFMGGFEDGSKPPPSGSGQRLILRGFVVMGAVEVKN